MCRNSTNFARIILKIHPQIDIVSIYNMSKKENFWSCVTKVVLLVRYNPCPVYPRSPLYQHEPQLTALLWAKWNSSRRIRLRAVQDDGLSDALGQFPAQTEDGRFYSVHSGYSTKFSSSICRSWTYQCKEKPPA